MTSTGFVKPWQLLLLIAVGITLVAYGVQRFRYRFVRSDADLVRLLPAREATTFFVNVAALRAAHLLQVVSAAKTEEADYRQFVSSTGFDYSRDLAAVSGSVDERDSYFVLRGRFDWDRLARYAGQHGGSCEGYCKVPSSRPGKWASFRLLQPNVMAVAVSPNTAAVMKIAAKRNGTAMVDAPVWVRLIPSDFANSAHWPLPLHILANLLRSARSVVFSAEEDEQSQQLQLHMQAEFPSEQAAETVRNQLELETKMLKLELAREHEKPSDSDVTGLLVSGTFQLVNNSVDGSWPLRREFLQSLQIQ